MTNGVRTDVTCTTGDKDGKIFHVIKQAKPELGRAASTDTVGWFVKSRAKSNFVENA
jgi:hypothetical protein